MLFLGLAFGCGESRALERDIFDMAWSFNAKKIAYTIASYEVLDATTSSFDVKSVEIWTCNRDASNAKRLTSGHKDVKPRWSPDGKQIVFTRNEDVWIVNADGTNLKQLNKTPLHIEELPEFSNDGKSLFYVRTEVVNTAKEGEKESLLPIDSQVMSHSLVSNQERERFKSDDEYMQIVPNRADSSEVFLLYNRYDPKIKTEFGEGMLTDMITLAAAKLDGTGRRVLKSEPKYFVREQGKDSHTEIQKIRAIAKGAVIQAQFWSVGTERENQLLIPTLNGVKTMKNPLTDFNDISTDGQLLLGIGILQKEEGEKWSIERTIQIVDVATGEEIYLDRSTLLGAKPTAIAPKPAPKISFLPPMAALEHFAKAENAFNETAYGEAIEEYSEAIKLFPKYAAAYNGRGQSYAKRNEWNEALEDFNNAIGLNPNEVDFYLGRAMMHFMLSDDNLALADYNTVIHIAPKSAKAYNERSMFYMAIGEKEKGLADEAKAKELEK